MNQQMMESLNDSVKESELNRIFVISRFLRGIPSLEIQIEKESSVDDNTIDAMEPEHR